MGAGHLNAFRAYQQFSALQWNPVQTVPAIGWDYRTANAEESVEYELAKPLKQGSFVSISLAWDRLVELNDKNKNSHFDAGENFRDRGLNNLNLYLVKADDHGNTNAICSSMSQVDSVEHIFCPVPATGNYKIRVQFQKKVNEATQPYALAWWTVPVK
jgi:hypothetical protein